jgi:parvulin-like peptidyl-prolyl isomerase
MKQEDREQTSAFSDFLEALGLSGDKKTQPETEIPEPPQNPEPVIKAPESPPETGTAESPEGSIETGVDSKPITDQPLMSQEKGENEQEKIVGIIENPVESKDQRALVLLSPQPVRKRKSSRKVILAAIVLLAAFCAFWYFRPPLTEPIPPGQDVVAAFNNRYITVSDLKDFIFLESGGQEDIDINSLEQYRQIIRIMAVEQIVQARAAQKGIAKRDDVKHNLQDLINDAGIETLVHQIAQRELSEEAIPKYEVQQYYDNNRQQYGEQNFSDVEHEIREILIRAKEQDFFPKYIEELKRATGLEVNFELLDTLGTTDESMAGAVSLRGDEALFNVHGRRYTLKNFYTEFRELPAVYQEQFSTNEARRQLLEQFAAKELLLEETGDTSENELEQHSLEELRAQYLTQLLHQEEVESRVTEPEEAEIIAFYEKNKEKFVIPVRVRISLIGISEGRNGENREQARKKAQEALGALRGGMEFAEAAKLYSEDHSAGTGGEMMEWVVQSYLPRDLGKAIFALKTGETSGIIESENALYIIKINERTEEEKVSYDDAKKAVIAYLKQEQHSRLQEEMETALFKEAGFTIYNRTLRNLLKGKI